MSAARRCAVLGSPVAHSLSPVLHRAAYAALGLPWSYDAIECGEARLPELLAGLGPEWRGLSLTMPLKRAVLPLLDEVEPLVGQVGAANTVVLDDGRRRGLNTDVPGLLAALAAHGVAVPLEAGVLGGGATAASAVAALGIGGARVVHLLVRRPEAAEPVLRVAEIFGVDVEVAPFEPAAGLLGLPLVLSTVPGDAAALVRGRRAGAPRRALRRRVRPLAHRAGGGLERPRGRRPRRVPAAAAPGGAAGRGLLRAAGPAGARCGRRGSGRSARGVRSSPEAVPPKGRVRRADPRRPAGERCPMSTVSTTATSFDSTSARLARVLHGLLAQAPEVEAAAVVSFDGLPMASALPAGMDEDRVAAMSAALLSLGERAAEGLGRGGLSQVYVEGDAGTVFLVSADDEAVLVAVAAQGAKAGLMLFEVRRAAESVADALRDWDAPADGACLRRRGGRGRPR